MREEILRMENVITEDNELTNLDIFNLTINKAEIMGLICMNDQGRRKAIELICRNTPIKFGRIYYHNVLVNSYLNSTESDNKVYVIEEKSKLIRDLSVSDNIFVLKKGFKKYIINTKVLGSQVEMVMEELGVRMNPDSLVLSLTIFERCVVEVVKALVQSMSLVIIKDLSNILSESELMRFYEILKKCIQKGISFLYIGSHHEEVFRICDRVSLMEDGKIIRVLDHKNMKNEVIDLYNTSYRENVAEDQKRATSEGVFSFSDVKYGQLKRLSFTAQKGECIVLFDKDNKINDDIISIIKGEGEAESGKIRLKNCLILKDKLKRAFSVSINLIPENAIKNLIFYNLSYIDNLCFLLDRKIGKSNIKQRIKKSICMEYEKELGNEIYERNIEKLSKQSLYNIAYYRIHLSNPDVVFCVQPFSGADMYLRMHIAGLIRGLKRKGIAVVILAVNLSDTLTVADKLYIISDGVVEKECMPEEFDAI